MTEYGRGPGSEPWHPEDPLYGDGGWEGQQAHTGHQPAYGGQQQHHYPQQQNSQHPQNSQHQQQSEYGDWSQGQAQQYDQQQTQYDPQYQGYGQQQYADPGQQYTDQGQQQYAHQNQQHGYHEGYQEGGWDGTGTHAHVPYAADPGDPYGQQAAAYGAEQPDFYGTPDAYPPPEPPARRRAEPDPEPEPEAAPEPGSEQNTDWDPGPDQGEHAFFAGGGADDDEDDEESDRGNRRSRGGKGAKGTKSKKSRNGCACLIVVLVFAGGIGGVGYVGYHYYKNRYSAPPDFAGAGTGQTVSVQVPKGSGGADIGRLLKEAGVVKSVDAFVSACTSNPDGGKIQAGAYILKKQMSAKNAVAMMLDPKSQANVLVTPGQRNVAVYRSIDVKLGLAAGSTRKVAESKYATLGLPKWADDNGEIKDPLEGFLFPGTYGAAKGMKPETVLKAMVDHANDVYGKYDFVAKAKALKLESPLQVITVASLVQAEGKTHDDYRKMAEVVYNRLKPTNDQTNQLLQFDSTFNYLKGESKIHISESEINSNKDPYNTYTNKGLPPGPIGNPGEDALKATLNPTSDGWIYFVATDGKSNTEFAKTYAEFQRLKDKFDASSGN
ncbi:endolytic transglycosylase MltG [Streptomyces sp. IBSBF 2953]|nr:endolytic transglycosylase MltG [Streptomyces hayashii]